MAAPFIAPAGEAIQFSGPGTRTDATRSTISAEKAGRGNLGNLNSFSSPQSSGAAGISQSGGRQQNRKSKQSELERKNWMILDQGELQQKDELETAFGVRAKEGGKSTADLWFSQKNGASDRKTAAPAVDDEDVESPGSKINFTRGIDLKIDGATVSREDSANLPGNSSDAKIVTGRNGADLTDVFRSNLGLREPDAPNVRSDFGIRPMNAAAPNGRGESITFGFGTSLRSAPTPAFGGEQMSRPIGSLSPGLSADPNSLRPSSFGSAGGNDAAASRARGGGLENSSVFSPPSALQAPSGLESRSFRSTFDVPSRPR